MAGRSAGSGKRSARRREAGQGPRGSRREKGPLPRPTEAFRPMFRVDAGGQTCYNTICPPAHGRGPQGAVLKWSKRRDSKV